MEKELLLYDLASFNLVNALLIHHPAVSAGKAPAQFNTRFGTHPGLVLVRPDAYVGFLDGAEQLPRLAAYLQKWLLLPVVAQAA